MFPILSTPVAHAILKVGLALLPMAPAAPPLVDLEAVLEDPSVYLGQTVRAYVQVHSEETIWSSYMTRFGPEDYRSLRVWSDKQLLWERADYEAPVARVFVPRTGLRRLSKASSQERFLCTLSVDEWFAGQPWISVERALPTRRYVPEGTLLHAIRAAELAERGAFAMAAGEYDRALAAPLPAYAAERLKLAREACAKRDEGSRGRPMEAQVQRERKSEVRR